ncbi:MULTISPECIES: nicotinamidase [Arthrobacter]|uniref:nicotinamidase n=1 Tax=Arthrobacter caoxuetaonis TaxID=2886935 RepID=A0A9X1MBF0_9MICC|nr:MULTISPECIES: nicotinamidase [Arthrobacter]MCC3280856.1 nicotinamidase [Arthrobacter caoxuetaonis]MCC3296904.1 nicotinamidase [Arthrobacter caoxuetaonis]MCC9192980.1 nicotinamidase [Arthrobacter sp. zg-Y916]USQ56280.1 nicotinamidase [Arthrobacter caoxuetaonis]
MTRALIVVDVQNDFCEGGTLAVPGGNDAAVEISDYIESSRDRYSAVVATQDWHIEPGSHFSDNPNFRDSWPVHCVAGTHGAALNPDLDTEFIDAYFRKGQYEAAYSGFEGVLAPDVEVPLGEPDAEPAPDADTVSLDDWLRDRGVDEVVIVGLATDYCVKSTALDAVAAGYDTYVIPELCRGLDRVDVIAALDDLEDAGVELLDL